VVKTFCAAVLLCTLCAASAFGANAADPAPHPGSAFFKEGLDSLFTLSKQYVEIANACAARFKECADKANKAGKGRQGMSDALDFMNTVTVFGKHPKPPEPIQSARDAALQMHDNQMDFMAQLYDQELELVVQMAALIRQCSPERAKAENLLNFVTHEAVTQFWSKSESEFSLVADALNERTGVLESAIRKSWAPGECAKTLEFGTALWHEFTETLRPYRGQWQNVSASTRFGAGSRFVLDAALLYEQEVNPNIGTRER
jgi:hypothetical protein